MQILATKKNTIRTVIKDDGVWFVAKDVALCLGYSDTNKLTRSLRTMKEVQKPLRYVTPRMWGSHLKPERPKI